MKNYRPVSNLNFITKIIEKIMSNRIRSHLDKNYLSNTNQSAYKPLHSTETALLKIHNDICMNMDSGKATALVLLDLSAAFDTLDHSSIIEPLSGLYGISGTALNWVRSYLSSRVQKVKLLDKLRNRSRLIMVSPRALSWDHSYSLYIQRPSVGITYATFCTLKTHRFIFLSPIQTLRCHCRWSSNACKTFPTG